MYTATGKLAYATRYGCDSWEKLLRLNGNKLPNARGCLLKKFSRQRSQAKRRGIAWDLTFEEFATIWRTSGKFSKRGNGGDRYCMARHGDIGAYSKNNVAIITNAQNLIDGGLNRRRIRRKLLARAGQKRIDISIPANFVSRGWNRDDIVSVRDVIDFVAAKHGRGLAGLARALKLRSRMVLSNWRKRGSIPVEHQAKIMEMAAPELVLSPEMLSPMAKRVVGIMAKIAAASE